MSDEQKLLAELLKLKLELIKILDSNTFRVSTESMLDRVNEIITKVQNDH